MSKNRSLPLFIILMFLPVIGFSQFSRFGGGLSFSSGVDFNGGRTGNPGITIKGYYKGNDRLSIVPALTVFSPNNKGNFSYKLTNYMFHIDLDGQYGIMKEDQIVLYGLAGINATTIVSRYKSLIDVGGVQLENDSSIRPGINLGAGLKLYVNKAFSGYLQTKYTAGGFNQLVISLGAIYHPEGNYRRKW